MVLLVWKGVQVTILLFFTIFHNFELLLVLARTLLLDHWFLRTIFSITLCVVEFFMILRREGGPGSKRQVWLISKSNLSCSYYFLQNCKIFVYDENMARQSSGVLLSPIQNIGGKMTKNGHFRSIFLKVLVS